MVYKRILFLFFSTIYCIPKDHQREVVEELRRIEQPLIFDSSEKLNKKMKGDPYPENLIDCQLFQVCNLCSAQEGYQITHQNNYLIGLHYNYKQEIKELYEILSHLVNQQELFYSISKKGIQLTSILEKLNINFSNELPFPQLFQREDNITLSSILLFAQFHIEWTFQVNSLNYTGSCISNFFVCQEFHEFPKNNSINIQGYIKGNKGNLFQITQYDNQKILQIQEIKLPDLFFDKLIRMFFGDRFIEQIEHEQDKNYQINIMEKNERGNHELILILEVN